MYLHGDGLRMYDFGGDCGRAGSDPKPYEETCNQARYGQDEPPTYDLSKVTARAAIFEGGDDIMATKEDVKELRRTWRADVVYDHSFPKTAHMVRRRSWRLVTWTKPTERPLCFRR
jgi:hypothetical protein